MGFGSEGRLALSIYKGPAESRSSLPAILASRAHTPPTQCDIMSTQSCRCFWPGQYLHWGSGPVAMDTGNPQDRKRLRGADCICLNSLGFCLWGIDTVLSFWTLSLPVVPLWILSYFCLFVLHSRWVPFPLSFWLARSPSPWFPVSDVLSL